MSCSHSHVVFRVYCLRRVLTLKGRLPGKVHQAFCEKIMKAQVKIRSEHDFKWPKDRSMKPWNSEDLDRKCLSLHDKEPYPNCGETDAKDPHVGSRKFQKTREATGRKPGLNWAQAGRPRPAGPAHFRLGSAPPLTKPPFRLFIAPVPRSTHQFIRHPLPRSREAIGTPSRRGGLC
jgi:hypothetical protein